MSNLLAYTTVLESHYYGLNGSAIKYLTRNICADATAKILEEVAATLFPNEKIEIYVLPAQDGCHLDSFWIKAKKPLGVITVTAGTLLLYGTQVSQLFTDASTRELGKSQIQVNQSQEELNKLQIEQLKKEADKHSPETEITADQLQKVFESQEIKRNRNRHFRQLQADGEIKKEKFVAKSGETVISEKTIESVDFGKYIENLPKITTVKTVEKIHRLIVIKSVNDRQYKELMWNVEDENKQEKFGVYMADEDFYQIHLEKIFGLKTLTARVRYTLEENESEERVMKKKEIVLVYAYNGIQRFPIPEGETIEPAPFGPYEGEREDFKIAGVKRDKNMCTPEDQLSMGF